MNPTHYQHYIASPIDALKTEDCLQNTRDSKLESTTPSPEVGYELAQWLCCKDKVSHRLLYHRRILWAELIAMREVEVDGGLDECRSTVY